MKKITLGLILSVVFAIVGCGDEKEGFKERPTSLLGVVPYDAELKNAAIEVFAVDEMLNISGDALATGKTNASGLLDEMLEMGTKSQWVIVAVGAEGTYVEEASGTSISLNPDDKLYGLTYYTSGENLDITVSGFTHLATAYAQCLVQQQGAQPENAAINAFSGIAGMYSFNPLTTVPRNPSLPESTGVELDASGAYGIFAASVSQKMKRIAEDQGVTVHQDNFRSFDFYQYGFSDILDDPNCALDGIKRNGDGDIVQVGVGSTVFDVHTYRVDLSVDAMDFLASAENVSDISPEDFTLQAAQLAQSEHAIFNGEPVVPFDETGPVVTFDRASDTWITSVFDLSATVSDMSGVESATLYIDNVVWGSAADPVNALFENINTLPMAEGEHVFKIVAEDTQGNTSETSITLIVNNTGPVGTLVSNKFISALSGTFTFQYADAGQGFKEAQIQGNTITSVDVSNQFSVALNLSPGLNTLSLQVTDISDTTNTYAIEIVADLMGAGFDTYSPSGSYNVQYSASNDVDDTFYGVLDLSSPAWPLYYDDSLVTLNGVAATQTNLINGEFPYIRVLVDDFQAGLASGSYTERDEIDVYMDFYVGADMVIDQQLLTPEENNPGFYTIPLTTEFLTDDFYLVTSNTELRVVLTSLDLAGNTEVEEFDFELRYFVNPTVVTRQLDPYNGTGLFTMPGSGDSRTAYQTEITNSYPFPIEVKLVETGDFDTTLKYDTNRRVNRIEETVSVDYEFRCANDSVSIDGNAYSVDNIFIDDPFTTDPGDYIVSLSNPNSAIYEGTTGSRGEWVSGTHLTDYANGLGNLNVLAAVADVVSQQEYLADTLPSGNSSTTTETFEVWSINHQDFAKLIPNEATRFKQLGWVRNASNHYICPTAIMAGFAYTNQKEDISYRRIESTSYSQVAGYPQNESTAGTEDYSLSVDTTFNIDNGIDRALTSDFVELAPGQTLYVDHKSVYPTVNYKSASCSWSYAGNNECNTGMDINLDLNAEISIRPKLAAGTDTTISTSEFTQAYGRQDYAF